MKQVADGLWDRCEGDEEVLNLVPESDNEHFRNAHHNNRNLRKHSLVRTPSHPHTPHATGQHTFAHTRLLSALPTAPPEIKSKIKDKTRMVW